MKNPTYEHNVVQVVKLGNIYQLQYLASRKMGGFEENINFGLNDDLIPVRPFSLKKNDKKLSNNISRAISTCRQLALSNEWDYFITLTLDPKKYDRFDLEKFHFDVTSFFRSINRRYRVHVNYLLVPERHKNGAWHLHGLISKLPSCLLNINNNGYLDFELYSSKFGWCSLSPVRSQFAVALYITKHLGKQIYNGVTDLHEHQPNLEEYNSKSK